MPSPSPPISGKSIHTHPIVFFEALRVYSYILEILIGTGYVVFSHTSTSRMHSIFKFPKNDTNRKSQIQFKSQIILKKEMTLMAFYDSTASIYFAILFHSPH